MLKMKVLFLISRKLIDSNLKVKEENLDYKEERMILPDHEIIEAIKKGEIKIIPFKPENVGPCSVDLTLADEFVIFRKGAIIDPLDVESIRKGIVITKTYNKPLLLEPGQFILAKTAEKVILSKKYAATLEGRSSIARLGIVVHAAGLVNPGTGLKEPKPLVLEIFCQNSSPVKLYPGMKIVQIIFHKLSSEASIGYDERETKSSQTILFFKGPEHFF